MPRQIITRPLLHYHSSCFFRSSVEDFLLLYLTTANPFCLSLSKIVKRLDFLPTRYPLRAVLWLEIT